MADQSTNPIGTTAIAPTPDSPTEQPSATNLAAAGSGTPANGAQPTAAAGAQPSGAPTTPDSNAPQTDTAAGASIPKNLVNNPQVPSQKIATQVDLNKTSPAPHHSWLYKAAQELSGGPVMKTRYDSSGNAIREEQPVSLAHLGLAIAAHALEGGIAGGNAKDSVAAAQAGNQAAEQQKAKIKQAQTNQDAQAKADQDHKMKVVEANMKNYQTAIASAKSSMEAAKAYGDSFKDITTGLEDDTLQLPPGVTKSGREWETDAMAAFKNGKTNSTTDLLIPVGNPKPVLGADGQQVVINGVPQVGHDYITLHGVGPDGKIPLSEKMQKSFIGAGLMPETPAEGIGQPMWSLADIANKTAMLASINAGEQMLTDHKNDAHDYLGRAPEDMDDLKAAVKSDPRMRKAVDLFARAQQGASSAIAGEAAGIDDIFRAMDKADPGLSGLLKNFLHLSPKDLDDITNKRLQEHTEAAKEKQVQPLTPEASADIKAQTEQRKALANKANADAYKARKEADALSSGGKMPDGTWNMNSTPVALVEADMDPTQMSKRSKAYDATIEAANKYSNEKYGKPFDMARAQSDYRDATNAQLKQKLKMIDGMAEKGGSIDIAAGESNGAAQKLSGLNEQTLNKVWNIAKTEFGNDSVTNFHTAMLGLADEYSQVMGAGAGSDTSRQQALDLLKDAYSKGQLAGAVGIMRKDIAARKQGLIGGNRYLIRQYGAPGAVKLGGQYFPKDADGTYHVRGFKYNVSPDGKSLVPAGGK